MLRGELGDAQPLAFGHTFRAADKSMHLGGGLALPDGQSEGAAQKAGADYTDVFQVHGAIKEESDRRQKRKLRGVEKRRDDGPAFLQLESPVQYSRNIPQDTLDTMRPAP